MLIRWIDPHKRRSLALAAVMLSLAGLVLADRGSSRRDDLLVASGPIAVRDESGSTTSRPFRARGISGRFAISHGRLLASGTRSMYVELRVRESAGEPVEFDRQAPVAMVLVIDTSGSMAGRKIEDARRAALALLDQMRADDRVSVVRFATQAEILVPLGKVGDIRAEARRSIERLDARGNTDIAGALRTADRVLGWTSEGYSGRIVLVTDGRDTSGAPPGTGPDVARAEAKRGITVSALGIGADFDDAYLAGISREGRGNYEFLSDSSALSRFLSKELHEAARTRVQNVEIALSLPAGVRIREVWGATREGDRLSVGSLFEGDERRVIAALDVPMYEAGSSIELSGSLSGRLADGSKVAIELSPLLVTAAHTAGEVEEARDVSVLSSVTSVIASSRETEAATAFERGDRRRALELNQQNRLELEKARRAAPAEIAAQLDAQKRAYESHRGVFSTAPPSAAAARGIGAAERKNADRALAY